MSVFHFLIQKFKLKLNNLYILYQLFTLIIKVRVINIKKSGKNQELKNVCF